MFRSLLFVPGNSARFLEKARELPADIVCFDLEDSVPPNEKERARGMVAGALVEGSRYRGSVYVRTNSFESGLLSADLESVVRKGIEGIVVPKVNDENEIRKIKDLMAKFEAARQIDKGSIRIMPSIETSVGVVNAYRVASADERVNALVFGVFDFLYDMRVDYDEDDATGYSYARAKVPVDARAAGVHAIDGIWQKVDDIDGLSRDAIAARRLGYSGKSIIHPSQIQPVHQVFVPTKSEIEWANKVIKALGETMEKGSGRGAVRLQGRMIDAVHYKHAKSILDSIDRSKN